MRDRGRVLTFKETCLQYLAKVILGLTKVISYIKKPYYKGRNNAGLFMTDYKKYKTFLDWKL